MRGIDSAELARMTASHVEAMNDLCDIYHFNGTADSLGEITQSWDTGTFSVVCGFVEPTKTQARAERGQIVIIDVEAQLRLPQSQSIEVQDKIVVRSETYYVDNVVPGRNVKIVELVKDFHDF